MIDYEARVSAWAKRAIKDRYGIEALDASAHFEDGAVIIEGAGKRFKHYPASIEEFISDIMTFDA